MTLTPGDEHILFVLEEVGQVVDDEEVPLVAVGPQQDVGLLEVLGVQRLLRRLVEEGAVDYGDERKLGHPEHHRVPLLLHLPQML